MPKRPPVDPIVERLDEILEALRDLVIIEAANAGLTRDSVRGILRVENSRVSRTWKQLKGERDARR